jgi:DNA-binding response OmpR family regulator
MLRGLGDALSFEGYEVISASTGEEGVEEARKSRPDLVVLDLMLPGINGFQVCEEIRGFNPNVPIIMLTARHQEADKVRGLELGADDYVTKPFSVAELLARIRAMFRRMARVSTAPEEIITVGDCTVDLNKHTLSRGNQTHTLTFYETELLRMLHKRKNEPVPRDEILDEIWGLEATPTNRTVDNFIVKLRRKIEDDHKDPRHILTIYGVGYKLVP